MIRIYVFNRFQVAFMKLPLPLSRKIRKLRFGQKSAKCRHKNSLGARER